MVRMDKSQAARVSRTRSTDQAGMHRKRMAGAAAGATGQHRDRMAGAAAGSRNTTPRRKKGTKTSAAAA